MPMTLVSVHAYPECKDMWQQLDAKDREQVLRFAASLWDMSAAELTAGELDDDIRKLAEKGLLVSDGDKWRFQQPRMSTFAQSINLIETLSLHSKTSNEIWQNLFELLRPKLDRTTEIWEILAFVLACLVNEFKRVDLPETIVSEKISPQQFWLLADPLCQSLPILDLGLDAIARIFAGLTAKKQRDLMIVSAHGSAEYLGRFRPEIASQLITNLVATADPHAAEFVPDLATGVAENSEAYLKVIIAMSETWLDSSITAQS